MVRTHSINKVLSIFLLISLLCTNISPAIFGLISYAIEDEKQEEVEIKQALKLEVEEFSKNNMQDEETEYKEKLILNLNYEAGFKEIKISDVYTQINQNSENEEIVEPVNIFYKSTRISKDDLVEVLGDNGIVEITYQEKEIIEDEEPEVVEVIAEDSEENNETNLVEEQEENEEKVLETVETDIVNAEIVDNDEEIETVDNEEKAENETKGIVIAADGKVIIDSNTEADEDGYITVVYPENTIAINITVLAETSIVENLIFINNRIIEKVNNLDEISALETAKNIMVKKEIEAEKETLEIELFNKNETVIMPIDFSQTNVELGVDKNQISTGVENRVGITLTMFTNSRKYDLFKNPQFMIELPKEIETVIVDKAIILNNNIFEPEELEIVTLENGNKALLIKLNGEQIEYLNSVSENIQIVLELLVTTEKLIPSLEREIILHYSNENARVNNQEETEENIKVAQLNLVSNSEVIVQTSAIIGENEVVSFKDDFKKTSIEPNTVDKVVIEGVVINNIGTNLENAKILGSATNIGKITNIENVYYTENENATSELNNAENLWTAEYTENAKKFLIALPNFEQGQMISFEYVMNLPTRPEEDITHTAKFEVFDNNNQLLRDSKITITQEAPRLDIFENDEVLVQVAVENETPIKIGEELKYEITVINKTDYEIEDLLLDIHKSNVTEKVVSCNEGSFETSTFKTGKNERDLSEGANTLYTKSLKIPANEVAKIIVSGQVTRFEAISEKININLKYKDIEEKISSKAYFEEPTDLSIELRSNKEKQALNSGDEIIYKLTVKNNGNTENVFDVELLNTDDLYIQKILLTNSTNNEKVHEYSGVDLNARAKNISIEPNEVLDICFYGIAKELKKENTINVYAKVSGESILEKNTSGLTNIINKKPVDNSIVENDETTSLNVISGIAWLDKNMNGRMDDKEIVLKDVEAKLINTADSTVVATQITNNNGEYKFTDVPKGKYVVEFNYNNMKLNTTEYKNEKTEDELDSDVINTTLGDVTTSKTELIALSGGQEEKINAGFVINKKFDLKIDSKITNETEDIIEYEFIISNIGELAGYANLISDKMPEHMKFSSELNNNWYEGNDGKIYSVALSNKEIKPGESEKITLVLTKDDIISEKELFNITNIEKTFNEFLIEEKDLDNNVISTLANGRRK